MRTLVEKVYSGEDGRVQQLFCDKVPAVKNFKPSFLLGCVTVGEFHAR